MESAYHFIFLIAFAVPLLIFIYHLVKGRKQKGIQKKYHWRSIFNMSVLYVLAFNFVFFIQELFLAWGKNWIGLTSYLYHNNHNWEGSDPRASLLQGSGALSIFIFGLLTFIVYFLIRKKEISVWLKVLFLWLSLQGIVQTIPQIQTAFVATNTDVGQAMAYMGITGLTGFIIALLSTGLLIVMMSLYFNEFRYLGWFDQDNRKAQILSTLLIIVLPAVIACFIIIPFRILPWDRGFLQFFSLVTWVPWILMFSTRKPSTQTGSKVMSPGFVWWALVVMVIMFIVFQLILAPGVTFEV